MLLSGKTRLVGVIGWPVEHSVSPPMHNAAFRALGLDWCYVPLPVAPAQVEAAVLGAAALGFQGLNVTVPHKQAVLALMDELTPEARAIGAVNTVVLGERSCLGHNTDAQGFVRALREAGAGFDPADEYLRGRSALVLGAGGAARAVVCGLVRQGARVIVANRTVERAEALVEAFSELASAADQLAACPLDPATLRRVSRGVELIVNTTPLGMWPEVDASPWPEDVPFPKEALAYDLIYRPRVTSFMRQAQAAGARAADGLGMLVHQGAAAFELWTGQPAPTGVMYSACLAQLPGTCESADFRSLRDFGSL